MLFIFFLCRLFFLWPEPSPADAPEMIFVAGGMTQIGDSLGDADEKPVYQLLINDFYAAKTETTLAHFQAFIAAERYQTDAERGDGSYVWTPLGWTKKSGIHWRCDEKGVRRDTLSRYPVLHVSWNDAARYCNWLSVQQGYPPVYRFGQDTIWMDATACGYRLPTEAEWEYAASGGKEKKTQPFSGSDQLAAVGWYAGNAQKGAHPVGQKKPNALGLFDCSGNVWEWCQDQYSPGRNATSVLFVTGGEPRSIRGGSWSNNPRHCRTANRSSRFPDARDCNLGFRVVRSKGNE